MGQFRLSEQALRDLTDIRKYISADSIINADRLLARFNEIFRLLSKEAALGIRTAGLPSDTRRFPVGNYIIYYRKYKSGIQVLRVVHGMRDQRKALREKNST